MKNIMLDLETMGTSSNSAILTIGAVEFDKDLGILDRFYEIVDLQSCLDRGYGRMSVNGYTSAVHRVMYVCVNGYLPNKIQVDHICNNRLCCNPEHLQQVSCKKNHKLRIKRSKK